MLRFFVGIRWAMRDLLILIVHFITTVIRLAKPGGLRAVVAESVLAKHQLLIVNRSRRRAPNLRIRDRLIAGLCSLWIKPSRFQRVAILFKPSTLLSFILLWFNESIVSSDHDPLYRFHQWEANLRIPGVARRFPGTNRPPGCGARPGSLPCCWGSARCCRPPSSWLDCSARRRRGHRLCH